MNFLAHLYLSGENEHLMVGNFIADAVKGKKAMLDFPEEVQRGIRMHREIDHYMDTHPLVKKGMDRLREGYPKFSGVVMDIFYDHLLAVSWERYHAHSLPSFTHTVFDVMDRHQGIFPEKVQQLYPYFKRQNWMLSYASVEGIGQILGRMSRRIDRGVPLQGATVELQRYYAEYEAEFAAYFSEIMDYLAAEYNILYRVRK